MGLTIKCREDLALLPRWLKQIVSYHCKKQYFQVAFPVTLKNHVYLLQNTEVDVWLRCGNGTTVIVELKENDVGKAVQQAIRRRSLADYVYVALNMDVSSIIGCLRNYLEIFQYGVGVVSTKDEVVVIRSYRRNIMEALRYRGLAEAVAPPKK